MQPCKTYQTTLAMWWKMGREQAGSSHPAVPSGPSKPALLHAWPRPFPFPSSLCFKTDGKWTFEEADHAFMLVKHISPPTKCVSGAQEHHAKQTTGWLRDQTETCSLYGIVAPIFLLQIKPKEVRSSIPLFIMTVTKCQLRLAIV